MRDILPPAKFPDENLKVITHCPVCHYHYNPVEAKLLAENDGAHLLYIKCQRCQSAVLALVLMSGFGLSSVGLITDLESQEVAKFQQAKAISGDEILELFSLLHSPEAEKAILQ